MTKRLHFYCVLLLTACFGFSAPASGDLQEITDHDLSDVYAASGISFGIKNVQLFHHIDSYTYCAPDNGGYLQFKNIQFTDGQGGDVVKYNFDYTGRRRYDPVTGKISLEREGWYYDDTTNTWSFGTGYEDSRINDTGTISFDMAALPTASVEDWDINTDAFGTDVAMGIIGSPKWDQEIGLNIAHFIFSDGTDAFDLGSIDIGRIDLPTFDFYFAPHGQGGIDFEYAFEQHIDHAAYFFGATCEDSDCLSVRDIHIGSSFEYGTPGDDPSDPSTWIVNEGGNIGKFKIGDMFGNLGSTDPKNEHSRPAQIDFGANLPEADGSGDFLGAAILTLPMSGSLRFENVEFGGTDFGPGAIDGLNAYRMNVYLIP